MADTRAIEAACEAMMLLLEQSWRVELTGGESPLFRVYRAKDFADPMELGVSLFLYGVTVNDSVRTLPRRSAPGVPTRPSPLLLDLHLLLTPWAQEAAQQHAILGWMMRVLADAPVLPAVLLNRRAPGVFQPDETVEIVPAQLSNEEMFHITHRLPGDLQVSVPYTARGVRMDGLALENP